MSGTTPTSSQAPGEQPLGGVSLEGLNESELTPQIKRLPAYSQSLLRIEVPVVVTLAATRLPISRVLNIGPGTMLHFEKSYDAPLTLSVGTCDVAAGDAVKIGEKFGLRISSMILPDEKFEAVRKSAGQRS